MRVALVHYWLVSMGGGERVLESLCRMYPEAHIFTHVLNRDNLSPVIAKHKISTTFIDRLPGSKKHYQRYLPLMPFALEQLDLTDYDLIISSESGPAKGIVTKADSTHICYCHTPMRYIWDSWPEYMASAGKISRLGMRIFLPTLRRWDIASSFRVDHFVANSQNVAKRIRKHWRREAAVVHPPVNLEAFSPKQKSGGEYYCCLGRLTQYKRIDLAVQACSRLNRPLLVVGEGEKLEELKARAAPCVRFLGRLDDRSAADILRRSRALIFPAEEDFGIVPLEAAASGVPVLAYGKGGATETVRDGLTGMFFKEQNAEALETTILRFEKHEGDFSPQEIRRHAENFGEERFCQEFNRQIKLAQQAQNNHVRSLY